MWIGTRTLNSSAMPQSPDALRAPAQVVGAVCVPDWLADALGWLLVQYAVGDAMGRAVTHLAAARGSAPGRACRRLAATPESRREPDNAGFSVAGEGAYDACIARASATAGKLS
jgi:hypothetical protein